MDTQKKRTTWIIVGVIAIIAIWLIGTYNSLASKSQNVEEQWSQVENVMERRNDLIPNLVNSVKGSMNQENKVFGNIAKARENYNNADTKSEKMKANNQIENSTGKLGNIIVERYPNLKSSDNVNTLMNQLEGSENRIATERRRYNQRVNEYNRSLVTFPNNVAANMFGFKKKP